MGGCTHGLPTPLTSPTSAVDLLLYPCTGVHVTGVTPKPPSRLFFALPASLSCSDSGNLQDSAGAEPWCCSGSGPGEFCCRCGRQGADTRRVLLLFIAKFHILIQLLSHPVVEACLAFLICLLPLGSWKTLTFKKLYKPDKISQKSHVLLSFKMLQPSPGRTPPLDFTLVLGVRLLGSGLGLCRVVQEIWTWCHYTSTSDTCSLLGQDGDGRGQAAVNSHPLGWWDPHDDPV